MAIHPLLPLTKIGTAGNKVVEAVQRLLNMKAVQIDDIVSCALTCR